MQELSSEMQYPANNVFEKETLGMTLGAWVTALVKCIRVSRSDESSLTKESQRNGIIFLQSDDILQSAPDEYIINLFEGTPMTQR